MWSSVLFHVGLIVLFFGHLFELFTPIWLLDARIEHRRQPARGEAQRRPEREIRREKRLMEPRRHRQFLLFGGQRRIGASDSRISA